MSTWPEPVERVAGVLRARAVDARLEEFEEGTATAAAAARAAGCEEWFVEDARATLAAADERLVDRLREGSRVHAARRVHELDDAAELLGELGVRPHVTTAARAVLAELTE